MKEITFEYYDRYCRDGKWNKQSCIVEDLDECIRIYGLGKDCEYRIISIEDTDKR